MSGTVIPLTSEDVSRHDAFRTAEMQADSSRRPLADEMIAVLDHEYASLGVSIRAAHRVNGGIFDPATMRRYVVLRYVIDLVERNRDHKAEVAPILYPELVQRQRRRA